MNRSTQRTIRDRSASPAVQSLLEVGAYAAQERDIDNLHQLVIEINLLLNIIETRVAQLQAESGDSD